jgi:hypothetical protein
MPKKSHRARYRDNNKKGAKDPICYERKLKKEISHRQAKLAEIRSAKKTPGKRPAAPRVTTPQTVEQTELQATLKPDTAEKRVIINGPEFCALDFHLFEDLDYAVMSCVMRNVVSMSWLPVGHEDRFDNASRAGRGDEGDLEDAPHQ